MIHLILVLVLGYYCGWIWGLIMFFMVMVALNDERKIR